MASRLITSPKQSSILSTPFAVIGYKASEDPSSSSFTRSFLRTEVIIYQAGTVLAVKFKDFNKQQI